MFNTGHIFLNILLYFILFTKLLLMVLTIFKKIIIKRKILSLEQYDVLYEYTHKSFYLLMPILLIILFNPFTTKYMIIDNHTKFFLFIFGILQLTTELTKNDNNCDK